MKLLRIEFRGLSFIQPFMRTLRRTNPCDKIKLNQPQIHMISSHNLSIKLCSEMLAHGSAQEDKNTAVWGVQDDVFKAVCL